MYTVHNNFRKALYAEEFNIAYFLNPKLQKLYEKITRIYSNYNNHWSTL